MRKNVPGWPLFRLVFERADRLDQMMAAVSVDPLAAVRKDQGAAFIEARRACITCQRGSDCAAWLVAAGDETQAPEFCPNAKFFRDLDPSSPPRPTSDIAKSCQSFE